MMPRYANGFIPESALIELGSGVDKYGPWKHLAPAGTAARWRWMVKEGIRLYGVTLTITPGWNVYRPYRIQVLYREDLGIWAAVPGTSSHGGEYRGSDCMAIDVYNWAKLADDPNEAWRRFSALCAAAGFRVDFVAPRELWHIGDFDPWNIPAWLEETPLPLPEPEPTPIPTIPETEEDDMAAPRQIHCTTKAGKVIRALIVPGTGYFVKWSEGASVYANNIARGFDTGSSVLVTESMFGVFEREAIAMRPKDALSIDIAEA